jgi:putative aldouronate transport system permease protein
MLKLRRNKKILALTLMMLPGALWLLLIRYLPMFGIAIAFQDYTIYTKAPSLVNNVLNSPWNNFKNFTFIFSSSNTGLMIRNTLGYNALWILLTMAIAVALAVMLNEITKKLLAKIYQTLMFFPYFISWVVVSYFVFAFLSPGYGVLRGVSEWYNDPWGWPVILTIASLWKGIGYSCVLYLAAITGIDHGLYEAAAIDGATKWRQIIHITIPSIRPMIIILFIMAVGRIFNADFGLFYNVPMSAGALYPATMVVDLYVYNALTASNGNIGMSTAAGLLQNIIGFVCIMGSNYLVRKVDPDSSLF